MTFNDWWMKHHEDICYCKGVCFYKVFMQQESWAESKAVTRILQFLKVEPHDPMPQEYLDATKYTDVLSKSENQTSPASVKAD